MGTYNWNPVVEVDYPETFQRTLSQELNRKSTFRYIYLGGAFTVQDQGKSLWLFAKGRKVRVHSPLPVADAFVLVPDSLSM